MRTGDEAEIIDSGARRFRSRLEIDGREVRAILFDRIEDLAIDEPAITVAQSIPKGQKMDFVVEKLTELGVQSIVPLQSERTIPSDVGPNKLERWRRLAKSAAQQCGRTGIPNVAEPMNFEHLLATFKEYDLVLFPWELAHAPPLRDLLPDMLAGTGRILVVIGPEGGFSHSEAETAQAAGARLISLGRRILRTETAAMVVLSILSYANGV